MAIKIVTDSTCDLPAEVVRGLGITVVPLKVFFGEEEFIDGVTITNSEFYAKMAKAKELPTTAQVNPEEFIKVFQKHLDNGDEVLGIFISSKLSGTCSSAFLAKKTLADQRVQVVDSESATFGLGLLVVEAAEKALQGQSLNEIVNYLERIKKQIFLCGIINNLENLKKGGRLTATGALAGSFLGIKPLITIKDGEVVLKGKARGLKKAYAWVLEEAKKNNIDFNSKTIYLAHADNKAGLEELKEIILKDHKPQRIIECEIGSVVGTHTGAGCVGVCCL
ncbi:MAG: DegV family protein [Desulfitobacteriia bacterium]|jgi:DegV family protein with EDD domain